MDIELAMAESVIACLKIFHFYPQESRMNHIYIIIIEADYFLFSLTGIKIILYRYGSNRNLSLPFLDLDSLSLLSNPNEFSFEIAY